MATTEWERRKAVSDRLRGIWDAQREASPLTWQEAFVRAQTALVVRLTSDADVAARMTFDEFARMQGFPASQPDPAAGRRQEAGGITAGSGGVA